MRTLLVLIVAAGCGGSSSSDDIDAALDPIDAGAIDASLADAAPCGLRPSGPLTRYAGNPVVRNGPSTYDDLKAGPRVMYRVGAGSYRLWYEAVSSSGITAVAYATSTDGLIWTKQQVVMSPTLAWERSEVSPNGLLFEDGVFKLWYHGGGYPGPGGQRLGAARIGYATSPDGVTWTKHATPVLDIGGAGAFDEAQAAEPRVFHLASGYRMYYTGRNAAGVNALGVATSPDGIAWTKAAGNPIIDSARWGNFWGGAFFLDGDTWHLWHGVESGSSSSLHYMSSADGLAWIDGPSNPVLGRNPDPNAADYGLVGDSVSGFRDGSTYRIFYTGFNSNLFGNQGRFEGICAASIESPCP